MINGLGRNTVMLAPNPTLIVNGPDVISLSRNRNKIN